MTVPASGARPAKVSMYSCGKSRQINTAKREGPILCQNSLGRKKRYTKSQTHPDRTRSSLGRGPIPSAIAYPRGDTIDTKGTLLGLGALLWSRSGGTGYGGGRKSGQEKTSSEAAQEKREAPLLDAANVRAVEGPGKEATAASDKSEGELVGEELEGVGRRVRVQKAMNAR